MDKTIAAIFILTGIIAVGVFFLTIRMGGSADVREKGESLGALTALSNFHNFGTISMQEGKVEHLFELKNESGETVTLGALFTSCMCTETQVIYENSEKSILTGMKGHGLPLNLERKIEPGETFQIKAIFDPAAHGPQGVGPVHRVIYLETNSKTTFMIELSFDANVTP